MCVCVSWRTSDAFGFSPGSRATIEAMFRDIEINGGLSAPFKVCVEGLGKGVACQGCCTPWP